jgi:hypothetical protein
MNSSNKKAREYLKEKGIKFLYTCPHSRFQKDAFSVADMIIIEGGQVKLLQIMTNNFHDITKFERFVDEAKVPLTIMLFKDRVKEPRIRVIEPLP